MSDEYVDFDRLARRIRKDIGTCPSRSVPVNATRN